MSKKATYDFSYNQKWEEQFKQIEAVSNDKSKAYCILCKKEISISNQGVRQVNNLFNTRI